MQQESIYNLIPKEYVPPPKEKMYKSKFPYQLPPTASTFNNHTTSRPRVNNINGNYQVPDEPHTHKGFSKSLGRPMGAYKPSSSEYRKKHSGTMGSNELPDVNEFRHSCSSDKKAQIPKKEEKPLMVSNAVETILSAPKQMPVEKSWVSKKNYGKVPDYLTRIQDSISSEYRLIQDLHLSEANEQDKLKQNYVYFLFQSAHRYIMSPNEVEQLRNGLKQKWEAVNKEYQKITHTNKIDTVGLKRRKETCEKELAQLEKDIQKLNKQYIFVDTNQ